MLNSSLLFKRFASKACYEIRFATTSLRKKAAPRFGFISLRKTIRDYVATKKGCAMNGCARFGFISLRNTIRKQSLLRNRLSSFVFRLSSFVFRLSSFVFRSSSFVFRFSFFVFKFTLYKVIVIVMVIVIVFSRPLVLPSSRSLESDL